jgi:hypothetical protein
MCGRLWRSFMHERSTKDRLGGLLDHLGISKGHLRNTKLGPGVVGRNSAIAYTFLVVMLVGALCSYFLKSEVLMGISLGGAILVTVIIAVLNVYFGNKNPGAAILEGAQFLQYHQIEMASKDRPAIDPISPPMPPPPGSLLGGNIRSLHPGEPNE